MFGPFHSGLVTKEIVRGASAVSTDDLATEMPFPH